MPDHPRLEERIAGLEGSYKELTKRIDDLRLEMHRGMDGLRAAIDCADAETDRVRTGLKPEISALRSEVRSNFRWMTSLILINWLSLLAAIFFVAGRR